MISNLCLELKRILDRGGGKGGTGLCIALNPIKCVVVKPTDVPPSPATSRADNNPEADRQRTESVI